MKAPQGALQPRFYKKSAFRENLSGYIFILPGVIFFLIFTVYPLIEAFILSFSNTGLAQGTFVGLKNYATLFSDATFIKSLFNTFKFVIVIVPVTMIIALFVSTRITDFGSKVQTFFRAAFYLPVVLSVVSVSLVWKNIYNLNYGILNYFMDAMGLEAVNWLGNTNIVIFALSVVVITFSLGQPIILFLAALNGIDASYYEAADVDGATWFTKFRKITIPLLAPTTLYVLITTTINAFQTFAIVDLMTGGGPNYGSSTLLYLIYKTAFTFNDFGLASAQGVVLFFCIAAFGVVQFIFFTPKD